MELSQTALAMLLLGGIPAGVVLNFAYALTDIGAMAESFVKKLIRNVKDFIFLLISKDFNANYSAISPHKDLII